MSSAAPEERSIPFGQADLSTCDREPIHIPGSIYPHGALLVLDRASGIIEQSAGDTKFLLGIEPVRILGLPLSEVLEAEAQAFVSAQCALTAPFVPPDIRLGMRSRCGSLPLDISFHALERMAIVELEPARRTMSSAGDPITQLKTLLAAIQRTPGLSESLTAAAVAMRAATGFDRAMVYRFLPDDSGMVAAEDARSGLESFLGLHYPASDIPKQARELYRRNWLRAIPDVDYVAAPLAPALNPRTGQPVDMSHCALRSVSPIHLEYLRNMGVRASLSASIVCSDRLWGMLVLHHYSPRHVSADLRVACETFAQMFSLHIEARMQAETSALRIGTRSILEELIARLMNANDIAAALAVPELLRYVGASGAVIYVEGAMHCVGDTPERAQILALVHWLNGLSLPLFATEHLSVDYPQAAGFSVVASGLLALGVSRVPRDYVLWLRPEVGVTVRWAGDPSKSIQWGPLGPRLTPRGSFAEWLEEKKMQSSPWSEVDLEAAEALRVILLERMLQIAELRRREREFAAVQIAAEELETRVAQRTEQLRVLTSQLEAAESRERQQIARDLHDDLSQTLAAARIRLSDLCGHERQQVRETAAEVGALIDLANNSIRSLAAQLSPAVLYELGLSPALDWLGEEIEHIFGLKVSVVDDGQPKPLSQETRSILYRAVRELLINVAKHARTGRARVESERRADRIWIRVVDDGIGYDQAQTEAEANRGIGLLSVRERLSLIGGTAQVLSTPEAGTVAMLSAPLAIEEGGSSPT